MESVKPDIFITYKIFRFGIRKNKLIKESSDSELSAIAH